MKESKFIELLNLYIDQQIEPADAVALEEEILRHPQRRRIYQQYCRMHRASALLFEQARPESSRPEIGAKLAATADEADEKMIDFSPARRFAPSWIYGSGLAAAAACLAVVFVNRPAADTATSGVAPTQVAMTQPAERAAVAAAEPAPEANQRPEYSVFFAGYRPGGERVTMTNAVDDRPALDWMRQLQLTPLVRLSDEQLSLDTRPPLRQERNSFSSPQPVAREMTAYQFQR